MNLFIYLATQQPAWTKALIVVLAIAAGAVAFGCVIGIIDWAMTLGLGPYASLRVIVKRWRVKRELRREAERRHLDAIVVGRFGHQ